MEDTITTTYYIHDEFLKATVHRDDSQTRLSSAEVMTVALVASAFFGGNIEAARSFLDEYGYINKAISKSRFNRRLHAINSHVWEALFLVLAERCSRSAMALPDGASRWRFRAPQLRGGLAARPGLRQHPHPPLPDLSSRGAWADLPRLRGEQAALFLRFASASGGERGGRAGGVLSGGGLGG